jgi:type I restriction enzyme S subunit
MQRAAGQKAIPEGWRPARLGDVAEVAFSGVDKRTIEGEFPVKLCNYTDVFYNRRIQAGMDFMPATATQSELKRWALKQGDVLFTKDSETADEIGIPAFVADDLTDVLCGYHLGLARPSQATVNGSFLARTLASRTSAQEFGRIANGVTRFGLTLEATRSIPILLPPLPEQRAIAAVLDSIDDAIEGAEAVIAATGQLRDSLLHDLLTRGLPGQHTEWRDVPGLGTIPADWEVVRLGDVIPKFEYGTSVKCSSEPVGMPILRIPNIALGRLNLSDLKYADLGPKESASVQLDAGDVLLVRTNGNPDICGQCWVSDGLEGRWGFASYLVRGRADRSVVNPWFVGHFLRSEVGRGLLRGNIRTSAGNYNLSVRDIGSIPLPCPTLTEQEAVVNTVEGLARIVEVAEDELQGLRLLRGSTADALLTGRVRNKQYGGFE